MQAYDRLDHYFCFYSNYEAGKNRYRTHYLFELRSDDNQPQKLKRYVMEMNGNSLLDENSTYGPIGRLHSWLRRWNGRRCFSSIRKELKEDKASWGLIIKPVIPSSDLDLQILAFVIAWIHTANSANFRQWSQRNLQRKFTAQSYFMYA